MSLSHFIAVQSAVQRPVDNRAIEGVVIPGTWSAATGTAQVQILETMAIPQDGGDAPVIVQAKQLSTQWGAQYGPVGNERCILFRTGEGWAYLIIHDYDDVPMPPSGETWNIHYGPNIQANAAIKMTNDGSAAGDGKGGVSITLAELITLATAGGLKVVCDDNAGVVSLGSTGLNSNQGVVRKSDLQTAINNVIANTNMAISQLAARLQGGAGVAPSTVSAVTATGSTTVLSEG